MRLARGPVRWLLRQPEWPLVVLLAHLLVVALYATGTAVSAVPFRDQRVHTLVASPVLPSAHGASAVLLVWAITRATDFRVRVAGTVAVVVWAFSTAALFEAARSRTPPLALWAPALSAVVLVVALLMLARWGTDGDDREES